MRKKPVRARKGVTKKREARFSLMTGLSDPTSDDVSRRAMRLSVPGELSRVRQMAGGADEGPLAVEGTTRPGRDVDVGAQR